jgi:hypothetical protein
MPAAGAKAAIAEPPEPKQKSLEEISDHSVVFATAA